jgi:hypothetical protein
MRTQKSKKGIVSHNNPIDVAATFVIALKNYFLFTFIVTRKKSFILFTNISIIVFEDGVLLLYISTNGFRLRSFIVCVCMKNKMK